METITFQTNQKSKEILSYLNSITTTKDSFINNNLSRKYVFIGKIGSRNFKLQTLGRTRFNFNGTIIEELEKTIIKIELNPVKGLVKLYKVMFIISFLPLLTVAIGYVFEKELILVALLFTLFLPLFTYYFPKLAQKQMFSFVKQLMESKMEAKMI